MIPSKLCIPLAAAAAVLGAALPAPAEEKTGDKRVAAVLKGADLKYEIDENGDFKLLYQLDGDRTQVAYVNSNTVTVGGTEVREVWSIAVNSEEDFDAETAVALLKESADMKVGGWCVTDGNEENQIAYLCARIDAKADAETLKEVLLFVVRTADAKELEVTEEDKF